MQEATHELLIASSASSSTCAKSAIVCVIRNAADEVVSIGFNQCTPPADGCPRIGIDTNPNSYLPTVTCNTLHAEEDALSKLPPDAAPVSAEVYGHTFACPSCEGNLRDRGIHNITLIPSGYGTGRRC